jgi:hypothetical protein
MIRRTTWIVLAVFVVLVGVIWYQQTRPAPEMSAITPTLGVEPLFTLDATQVRSLKVEDAAGDVVLARKESADGNWQLEEPVAAAGATSQIDMAVASLTTGESLIKLEDPPAAEVLGLAPPAYQVTLGLADGQSWIVKIGQATPTNSGYYVQVGDGAVYVVSTFTFDGVIGMLTSPPLAETPTPEYVGETPVPGETPTP